MIFARSEPPSAQCHRQTEEGAAHGAKQVVHFTVGQMTRNLCPGDSGGPVFVNGGVVWVNSAYYVESGDDLFAEVGLMHQMVNQYADRIISQGMAAVIADHRRNQNAGNQGGVTPDQGQRPEQQGHSQEQHQDPSDQGDHLNQDYMHVCQKVIDGIGYSWFRRDRILIQGS